MTTPLRGARSSSSPSTRRGPATAREPAAQPPLEPGSRGEAVRELQGFLKREGYFTGKVDGVYRDDTARAVELFQIARELPADGRVDPETWKRIKSTLPLTPARAAQEALANIVARIPEGGGALENGRELLGLGLSANEGPNDMMAPLVERQVARNMPLARARLAEGQKQGRLSPDEHAQIRALFDRVAHDPLATLSLQALVLDSPSGLPGRTPNQDGRSLLAALHGLATDAPLHPAIARDALVAQLVRDIASPSAINQLDRATCTVTTLQIYMTMQEPAELVRLIAGLASPEGEVTLRDGQTLRRVPGTESAGSLLLTRADGTTEEIDDHRTLANRLWAPAFMELANGEETYSNYHDRRGADGVSGLYRWETDRAFDAMLGANAELVLPGEPGAIEPAMERLRHVTAKGTPVPAGLKWGSADASGQIHGNHEVLVTRLDDQKVYFHNPWGQEEAMPIAIFKQRLNELHFPPGQ